MKIQKLLLWSAGSFNLILLLLILGLWRTGDRVWTIFSSLWQAPEISSQVESSEPIVHRIRNMQELTTTLQTVETIVPAQAERKLGNLSLGTTRLLYIARGEVRAGIDLSELIYEDIQVSDRRIVINLPPAKILDSKLDVNRSRVYDYDRGFLNLGPDVAPELQTLAQRKTLNEIVNTACQGGILEQANLKAQQTIAQLLQNTDQESRDVEINVLPAKLCDASDSIS